MQKGAGEQFFASLFVPFSVYILGPDRHFPRPRHRLAKFGNTKTAFHFQVCLPWGNDLGAGQDQGGFGSSLK